MTPEGIESRPISTWTNQHENFTHKLVKGASFRLWNPPATTNRERYHSTTKNFQWLIKYATENNLKMRAIGSGWSFTKIGCTEGGLIETGALSFSYPVPNSWVNLLYPNETEDLYFLQCGTIIHEINNRLSKKVSPRSIKASGASNGQTIAGALSTGTHGAAFNFGAIQEFVVGLHIIVGADEHVWLERASYPVASQEFLNWLGSGLIQDDDIFNSAVVSFGSFGFIHGVMIETEPLFLLEEHRLGKVPYDESLKKVMKSLDFSEMNLSGSGPDKELYHFEILFNLHNFEKNNPEKGAFIKYLFKKPYQPYIPVRRTNDFTYGDDLLGIISTVLDVLGPRSHALVPALVNQLFQLAFKPQPPVTGTLGEIFNYTKFRGKVASAAIGIDIKDSPKVVEMIIDINKRKPFAGGLALRYVKGTRATLGFTKFPKTCVLEMDGVDGRASRDFFEAVWNKLEELNIPYTLHWGKINFNLNEERIKNMYGKSVNTWIESRNAVMTPPVLSIFNNEFLTKCGLDEIQEAII